jgi:hypothetical protein
VLRPGGKEGSSGVLLSSWEPPKVATSAQKRRLISLWIYNRIAVKNLKKWGILAAVPDPGTKEGLMWLNLNR